MLKIALTGSIAMGKSTSLDIFKSSGIPIFDADKSVHVIYENPPTHIFGADFNDVMHENQIDRQKLLLKIMSNPDLLPKLEKLIHPLVEKDYDAFCEKNKLEKMIIYDIPLLFEKNKQADFDMILVVSTSKAEQEKRALQRPFMTREKLDFIRKNQIDNSEKRKRAHYIIKTDFGVAQAQKQISSLLRALSYIQTPGS